MSCFFGVLTQAYLWTVDYSYCIHVLKGHRSTVRCLKMFHGRPIAVTGGRDATVRIWDIRKGVRWYFNSPKWAIDEIFFFL